MAPSTPLARTIHLVQIPKRLDARGMLSNVFALRRTSKPPVTGHCIVNMAHSYSKLIDVSQDSFAEDGSKMTSEYPRLFNERFPPLSPTQPSRPPSAPSDGNYNDGDRGLDQPHSIEATGDENDNEDEATWLGKIVGNSADAEGSWVRVVPIESGALTFQFGDPFDGDQRPAR